MTTSLLKVLLIAFGGPSSSGKTTAAKALQTILPKSLLVHLDDFYLPSDLIPYDEEVKEQNWDVPEAIDFNKFKTYIDGLRTGKGLNIQIDSLEGDTPLKLDLKGQLKFKTLLNQYPTLFNHDEETIFVLVDGFMLYHDPKITELFDIRFFFHAPYETLKYRREHRHGYNTDVGVWVDPPGYFDRLVWPGYVKTHKYLFINEDVDQELTDYAKETLQLQEFKNDDSLSLEDMVQWSLQTIITKLS
ncbi:ribosylnicotinamide kinase [Scheffersomyces spartinae]|uniref:Ribosylnicotinamide kinase n=1 Tax=Scheffersomyces spartinae TaxID=45513 RepID=A0A9P7VC22_9ASCO|nr:ribosylnicotinamide kinase [Scheffersomyces spartinae]KAG7194965.1 ribosylnicotinamide kinase [Scheffersomyces spartinae]